MDDIMIGDCRKNKDDYINFMTLSLICGRSGSRMHQQTDRSFGIESKV